MNAFNHDIITIKQKHSDFFARSLSLSSSCLLCIIYSFVCLFISLCVRLLYLCAVCVLINCIFLCVCARWFTTDLLIHWFLSSWVVFIFPPIDWPSVTNKIYCIWKLYNGDDDVDDDGDVTLHHTYHQGNRKSNQRTHTHRDTHAETVRLSISLSLASINCT